MALVSLRDVGVGFGGPPLLDRVSLQVERGERVCLLGRNGAGKSTLMKLIGGELRADDGEVTRPPAGRIARLAQEVPRDRTGSVADEVGAGLLDGLAEGGRADEDPDSPASRVKVDRVLSRMKLDPDVPFESLSSGMKRRVLLARALVREPEVLLLDEPTNHLDVESIRWLEDFLLRYVGTLVFVTHDRVFLERLATRIVELDRGRLFDWSCDYPTFLARRDDMLAAEAKQDALFDKKLAQEEVWLRQGVKARRTRNEGRVRALEAMRKDRGERRDRAGSARMLAQEAERSGTLVVEAKGVGHSFGDREVIRDFDGAIMRGDRVGLVGPNGSGKTTLIRILLGEVEPSVGTVRRGTNLEVAYFDQLRATLDEEKSVVDNVSDGYDTVTVGGRQRHIIGYLQDFLFSPDRARATVKHLSGGERNRLLLAKLFTKPSNVLVLDEPTNDLDVETLELLEELLGEYAGTLLVVSHDRAFLNNVVTSTLVFEPDGRIKEYAGGYDDAMARRAVEAPKPAPPSSEAGRSKGDRDRANQPRKITLKERRELEGLPKLIEELEADVVARHAVMADPSFYQREGREIAQAKADLEAVEARLADAYGRWEALEALPG